MNKSMFNLFVNSKLRALIIHSYCITLLTGIGKKFIDENIASRIIVLQTIISLAFIFPLVQDDYNAIDLFIYSLCIIL